MNIVLIEPKSPAEHVFSKANIPRLGSIILGTIMRSRGHRTQVIVESISGDVTPADLNRADLVAVSTITSTAPRAYAIGDLARSMGKTVVFGGPHVTFLPAEALAHGQFVVRGEGEETFPELVDTLGAGGDPARVAGLSFLRDGAPADNPPRPLVSDLDSLPIPDFSLVRGWEHAGRIVPIATSRGCPFNCKFCSVVPIFGRRMRYHSPERIIAEIRQNGTRARHIFFCDDNFAADPRRAKALLRRILEEKLRLSWSTQVRVDAARDDELLDLMKRTRCLMVYIGFESINPKTLEAVRKNQSLDEIKRSIQAFHRRGIGIHGMFIVGADDDLPGSVNETLRFARRTGINSIQFMMLTPLPGTETFQELDAAERLLTREWHLYDGSYAVFRPRLMTAYDLQAETYLAYRRFYSWASILRRAFSFDFVYASLRFYARLIVIRSRRRLKRYAKKLQAEILESARSRLGSLADRWAHQKAVLLADTVEGPYGLFLEAFLRRLGLKVQPVAIRSLLLEAGHNLRPELEAKLAALRWRTGILVVPFVEKNGDADQGRGTLPAPIRQRLEASLPAGLRQLTFGMDLKNLSLHQEALSLGLIFGRKLRRIRRAYRLALPASGL